ncbi:MULTISPECIES: hypothetical protein [Hydrocarboniphaga]|uniref:Uncharacterized protein n=1 Tax=Hydrocarboniphaga effusa AP103 TaxID=1172194 RepID=I7ZB42_9GAMM|nr:MULTISPECIES: hypothetical protein [Hydrocarboniphaga]EIT68882.1 hypothetical protein WQQ_24640 [Hydrocarboniphaga effusa AP103]MDZ4080589.1 hypothetical protein [Hydrocarboniphaga sp.]
MTRLHCLPGSLWLAVCCTLSAAAMAQEPQARKPAADDPQPSVNSSSVLELDSTSITGSRELPTVMNILPWKRASAAELRGAPDDTLLNQVLEPVNRVEYRRELRYAKPAGTP